MKNKIVRLSIVSILIIAAACLSVYLDMRNNQKPVEHVVYESIQKHDTDVHSPKFSVYTKDAVALDITILYANPDFTGLSVYCPTTQKYILIKNTDKIHVSVCDRGSYCVALRNVLRMYFNQYKLDDLTQTNRPITNNI